MTHHAEAYLRNSREVPLPTHFQGSLVIDGACGDSWHATFECGWPLSDKELCFVRITFDHPEKGLPDLYTGRSFLMYREGAPPIVGCMVRACRGISGGAAKAQTLADYTVKDGVEFTE